MIALLLALAAAPARPADFAWTSRLPPSPEGGLRWAVWTDSVYILSRRSGQEDVALFTDDGKLVPWAEPRLRDHGSRVLELPLQPAPPSAVPDSAKDSALVPRSWIAELARSDRKTWSSRARLDFGPGDGRPFVGEVALETSSDLSSWVRIGGGGICRVGSGERGIVRDSLSVSGRLGPYVRVSVVSPARIRLDRLVLSVEHDSLLASPAGRRVLEVEGTARAEGWEYDVGGDFPVDRFALLLPPQSAVDVDIFARTSRDTHWVGIDRTSFFRTAISGKPLATPPLTLTGSCFRHWRIAPTSSTLPHPPRIRVEWTPRRLLFLAGPGQGVRLAVGSTRLADPSPGRSEALFSAMSANSERDLALVPEVLPVGFARQGTGAPDPVSNTGRWVLALLVAAALSTSGLAWKVWRESTGEKRSGS